MERGRKKRMVLRAQATRLINECEQGRQVSLTPNEAGVLHARLTSIRTELDAVNNEIEGLVSEDDLEEEFTQVIEYNDCIVQCLARLEQRRNGGSNEISRALAAQSQPAQQINGDATETTTSQKMNVKLPRLELVKFSGRRHEWQPFWELFEQVVDNNDQLSTLDKFHYLRASLTGDAAAVLTGLPPTSRCYNDAKQLLRKRFGNEELLIQEHMKKLIDVTPVRASDDVRGLRRLYDTVSAYQGTRDSRPEARQLQLHAAAHRATSDAERDPVGLQP
ncbi:uncharacterized protein LOC119385534 [Rhipicephalus sanguineus]|uniref:uncharacterized protein LOC119385534 n=1 Tax=Rhipicephalus sanguineus TaxID=34632 RepID=UPI001892FD13|nr:uncharacterized protein LOC119385534 [Rhipicephalus sanguineus]